jgi:acyl dehydratase
MTQAATFRALRGPDINVGDAVTPLVVNLTSTMIVAGAIATRDFMPVHHDPEYARSQGAPDIFMNILSTNAYVARFITDWAGAETFIRNINIRLGVPAIPGQALRFSGEVQDKRDEGDECVVEISVRVANDMGDHATGTAVLTVPR